MKEKQRNALSRRQVVGGVGIGVAMAAAGPAPAQQKHRRETVAEMHAPAVECDISFAVSAVALPFKRDTNRTAS